MATEKRNKLNALYSQVASGTPITSASLAALGISSNLAGQYAKAGWLTRLGQGVYARANDVLDLYRCLAVLQNSVDGLHVGGKTALDWHGLRQYVSLKPTLQLYGWESAGLPAWFTGRFPAEYRRKRLFREAPGQLLHVQPHADSDALVSSPERALLEMLSEVGLRQPLQEAREIAGSTHHLRSRVLSQLLEHCTSIKTVRLCLHMGRELQLPWAKKLNAETLPAGSKSPWVSQSRDGLLVLK
jgi:hypothetical protein